MPEKARITARVSLIPESDGKTLVNPHGTHSGPTLPRENGSGRAPLDTEDGRLK